MNMISPKEVAAATEAGAASVPAEQATPAALAIKGKKRTMVARSFTMAPEESQALTRLKAMCLEAGFAIKKRDLLRIGIGMIQTLDAKALQKASIELAPLRIRRADLRRK